MREESHYYPLFEIIMELTDVPLLDTDLQEICDMVMKIKDIPDEFSTATTSELMEELGKSPKEAKEIEETVERLVQEK